MKFIDAIFGKAKPEEPIFPGERFSILKLNMPDGLAFVTVNSAYKDYPNKLYYPYLVGIELEIINKNENGHPVDSEAEKLNQIQDRIEIFLKEDHTVHPVARVTRNGSRDLLIYIDKPKLSQDKITVFFNEIQQERNVNYSIEKDPSWNAVAGLLR